MAGITLTIAQANLDLWLAADEAVSTGQSYSIKDRSLSRVDAAEISRKIDYWQGWVERLTPRTQSRTRYVVNQ